MLGNTKWPCFLRRRRQPHSDSFSRELLKLSLKKTAGTALSSQREHFSPTRPPAPSPARCSAAAGVAPGRTHRSEAARPGPARLGSAPPLTFHEQPQLQLRPLVPLGARFYSFAHRPRGGRMPAGRPGWGGSPQGGGGRGTVPLAGEAARR